MEITQLVQPVTFVACFILAEFLKLLFKNLNRKWLPYIMAGFGMILCPLILWQISIGLIVEGMISGFASSGGYDAIKALINKK